MEVCTFTKQKVPTQQAPLFYTLRACSMSATHSSYMSTLLKYEIHNSQVL